jgi:hypothetical protein
MSLPILPTSVIGSYSMPEWLERAKNDYLSRRLSRRDLDEMHDAVRKSAIKDQEVAGVDIVSDGEAQRDNMIDYFTERLPGVQLDLGSKRFYYDFYESVVKSKLASGSIGLADEARFLSRFTDRLGKISVSGPHTLVKRIQNKHYPSEEAFALDLGRVLNFELREMVRAGITELQIDEPYYSGFPEDLPWAAHLLRQSLRQAGVRGQLPVSVSGHPRGQGAGRVAGICASRRRGPAALQGIQRALQAGPRRDRREDAGSGAGGARGRPHPSRAGHRAGAATHHQPGLRLCAAASRRGVQQAGRDGGRHPSGSQ